jgi:hypothetical protein
MICQDFLSSERLHSCSASSLFLRVLPYFMYFATALETLFKTTFHFLFPPPFVSCPLAFRFPYRAARLEA